MSHLDHPGLLLLSDFLIFSVVMSFTPGPNNIMLASSGVNHGFRATLPLILGVSIGFPVMLVSLGAGAAVAFDDIRWLQPAMRLLSIAYMLWLAYKVATASSSADDGSPPLSFWQAAAFQWINPKAWVIALVTLSAYTERGSDPVMRQVFQLGVLSMIVGFASCVTWTSAGVGISRWIRSPGRRTLFNWSMAALLVVCAAPLLLASSLHPTGAGF